MEVIGYPNYLIYPDGRVYSNKSKVFLKIFCRNDGYKALTLYNNGRQACKSIHRLVATHYIPNQDNKPEIDHIDRNRGNNNACNLRWVSELENGQNKGIFKNNKCGIKNICYCYKSKVWRYNKVVNKKIFTKASKNKNIVLWCKFAHYLLTK